MSRATDQHLKSLIAGAKELSEDDTKTILKLTQREKQVGVTRNGNAGLACSYKGIWVVPGGGVSR